MENLEPWADKSPWGVYPIYPLSELADRKSGGFDYMFAKSLNIAIKQQISGKYGACLVHSIGVFY